jgi:peptide deformylase
VLEDSEAMQTSLKADALEERERVPVAVRVFINPVLRVIGDETVTFFEGCLSVEGFAALVERWREVEVTGLDEHGVAQTWRVKGWPARILQHEVDHLNGTLYIDRMVTRSFSTQEHVTERFAGKSMADIRADLALE